MMKRKNVYIEALFSLENALLLCYAVEASLDRFLDKRRDELPAVLLEFSSALNTHTLDASTTRPHSRLKWSGFIFIFDVKH